MREWRKRDHALMKNTNTPKGQKKLQKTPCSGVSCEKHCLPMHERRRGGDRKPAHLQLDARQTLARSTTRFVRNTV